MSLIIVSGMFCTMHAHRARTYAGVRLCLTLRVPQTRHEVTGVVSCMVSENRRNLPSYMCKCFHCNRFPLAFLAVSSTAQVISISEHPPPRTTWGLWDSPERRECIDHLIRGAAQDDGARFASSYAKELDELRENDA